MATERDTPSLPGWITEHLELYRRDPDRGHNWDSAPVGGPGVLPVLLLTTTGRKSGEERTMPLLYRKIDGNFIIVASKGGAPKHPAWYLNLKAHPTCRIQVAHDHFEVLARDAQGTEREALWQAMAEMYPPYNDYQKATPRRIPVVVLEPASSAA